MTFPFSTRGRQSALKSAAGCFSVIFSSVTEFVYSLFASTNKLLEVGKALLNIVIIQRTERQRSVLDKLGLNSCQGDPI